MCSAAKGTFFLVPYSRSAPLKLTNDGMVSAISSRENRYSYCRMTGSGVPLNRAGINRNFCAAIAADLPSVESTAATMATLSTVPESLTSKSMMTDPSMPAFIASSGYPAFSNLIMRGIESDEESLTTPVPRAFETAVTAMSRAAWLPVSVWPERMTVQLAIQKTKSL
jgi:hypothetical protein